MIFDELQAKKLFLAIKQQKYRDYLTDELKILLKQKDAKRKADKVAQCTVEEIKKQKKKRNEKKQKTKEKVILQMKRRKV